MVPNGAGSDHRNHCPNCLTSLHVDEQPGDRMAECGGHMEPIVVWVKKNGEWAIVHCDETTIRTAISDRTNRGNDKADGGDGRME